MADILGTPRRFYILGAALIAFLALAISLSPSIARDGGATGETVTHRYDKAHYTAEDAREAEYNVSFFGDRVIFVGIPRGYTQFILKVARYRPDAAARMLNAESFRPLPESNNPVERAERERARIRSMYEFLEDLADDLAEDAERAESFDFEEAATNARYAESYVRHLSDIVNPDGF